MISDGEFRRTNGGRNDALLERDLMKQRIVIDDCVVEVNADQHGIGWSNGCARRNGGCIIRNPRQHPRGSKTQPKAGLGLPDQDGVVCTRSRLSTLFAMLLAVSPNLSLAYWVEPTSCMKASGVPK